MLVILIVVYLVFTGVTSDDSFSPNCTFNWIVGGKSLELYEVDLPTKMSLVMEFDEESMTSLKIGLRMIEVLNRYVMGTPVVTENFVKSESGFETSPALTPEELTLLFASATDIGNPIPFRITNPVKDEPLDRSRRFTQEMQDQFEETLSKSPVSEVIPVLVSPPEIAEETSVSPEESSSNEEAAREALMSPPFDPHLRTWDDSESYTLRVLRKSKDPFKWVRNSHLMKHLRTPEFEDTPPRGNWQSELEKTIERASSLSRGVASLDNSAVHTPLFDMDVAGVREQNFQYNQDIERAYAESVPAGGANAIPCEDEEEVYPNFNQRQDQRTIQQRVKSHRLCKKGKDFSYDETRRRTKNKNRQAESRQQEQQKQRLARNVDSTETTTTEDPEIVRAFIKKKTQFNIFAKTFREILTWVDKCNDLVEKLESVGKLKLRPTMGSFPSHRNCFTKYGLSFISEDVSRMTQEKSYNLRYFSDMISGFEPNTNPDSQDVFLKGIGFYLLTELHDSLAKFVSDIHRRLTFFVKLVVQIGNRDLGGEVAPLLSKAPCAGGLSPEDVKISSVNLYANGIEGIYEISPVKQVKTYRRLQSVPYPVPGTDDYVYIYFDKDEYYDPSAPLVGSTASCEQVSKSFYCRSSTIVPKPHACMVALWYDSWDNVKENCNIGYRSQVNTPLTVSTSLGLLMADRSNVRSIKLHQALGSSIKDYIVENPVIIKYGGTITSNYGKHYQNFSANSGGELKICKSTVTESRIKELRDKAKNMDVSDHFRTIRTFLDKYGWYIGIGSIVATILSLLNCLVCCSVVMFKCKNKTPKFEGSCTSFLLRPRRNNIEATIGGSIEAVPEPEEQERLLRGNVDIQMRNLESARANRNRRVRMNLEPRMSM